MLQYHTLPYGTIYVFSINGGGFILVSADDCVQPVLGYSNANWISMDDGRTWHHLTDFGPNDNIYDNSLSWYIRCITLSNLTGITESSKDGFRIYPNPSHGMVSMSADAATAVEIYDLWGRRVGGVRLEEKESYLCTLAPGTYIVRTTGTKNTSAYKLIVSK